MDPFDAETESDEEENRKMAGAGTTPKLTKAFVREHMSEIKDYLNKNYPGAYDESMRRGAVNRELKNNYLQMVKQETPSETPPTFVPPPSLERLSREIQDQIGGDTENIKMGMEDPQKDFVLTPTPKKKPKLRIKSRVVGRRMRDGRLEVKGSKNSKCYTRENKEGEKYITCQPRYY